MATTATTATVTVTATATATAPLTALLPARLPTSHCLAIQPARRARRYTHGRVRTVAVSVWSRLSWLFYKSYMAGDLRLDHFVPDVP